jgi:tRNA(fMet)-specific endonuclease VapC
MNESLLDTDILSEIGKMRNKPILSRAREYRAEWGPFSISAVSVKEIVKGFCKSDANARLQRFLIGLENERVLPLTSPIAILAGRVEAELEKRGTTIGTADTMIAATAIEHGLVLVSGNTAHFERIRQLGFPLRLANWREADS